MGEIRIGTAGWSIPRAAAGRVPGVGTHLQRYSRTLNAAEINSSFHRPHAVGTYERWAGSTPDDFRFAVKLPRAITHDRRLREPGADLDRFLAESSGLGGKRAIVLAQLPPSLAFEADVARMFFAAVQQRFAGSIVCEPRHPSWFTDAAARVWEEFDIARVATDPAFAAGDDRPGGTPRLVYYRLHGSPRRYWSPYDAAYLDVLARTLRDAAMRADVWCMFDNTASGAALENALDLQQRMRP